jgi:hypothetical protein
MLNVKLFNKNNDYYIIQDFCNKRNLEEIDKDLLSDFGAIIFDNETPLVVGWLYPTVSSKLCIIENVISNKEMVDIGLRNDSIGLLFKTLHSFAKDMGYKYIKNAVENKSMKNRLESYGYMSLQDNVTNYMGVL